MDVNLPLIRQVFGNLVEQPIWAPAYYPTSKVPLNVHTGSNASTSDPATWGTLGEVLNFAQRRMNGMGGIGIMTGPHPILNPDRRPNLPYLMALDVDNGIRNGEPLDWAAKAIQNLQGETYTELSGSGSGVHGFGVVDALPVDFLPPGQWGRKMELKTAEKADPNGKTPTVELYFDRKFMLVTGKPFGAIVPMRNVTKRIPAMLPKRDDTLVTSLPITTLPPPQSDPDGDITPVDVETAWRQGLTTESRRALDQSLEAHADLRHAMMGEDWLDRSTAVFVFADLAKGYGLTLDQYVSALMVSTGSAGQHLNDSKQPFRAIARAWNRTEQPPSMESVPPVDPNAPEDMPTGPEADTDALMALLVEKNPLGPIARLPLNLLSMDLPLDRFLLADLIPAAPVLLAGAGGAGKSALTLTLAVLALIRKGVWASDWGDVGRIVYCTHEDEGASIRRRMQNILHALNVTQRQYQGIIRDSLFIDNLTGRPGMTLAGPDKAGTIVRSDLPEMLVDKYRNLNVGWMIFDPLNQFGPAETHGNDGAAVMMQIGWYLSRALRAEPGDDPNDPVSRSTTMFISHMSMNSARQEIDDAHAARSASALGDNARAVYVMHRHNIENPHNYIAPPSVSPEAIRDGRVMRFKVAKQSYATTPVVPFYIERQGWSFTFHQQQTAQELQLAQAASPTPTRARAVSEFSAHKLAVEAWIMGRLVKFRKVDIDHWINSNPGPKAPMLAMVPGLLAEMVEAGQVELDGDNFYRVVPPAWRDPKSDQPPPPAMPF